MNPKKFGCMHAPDAPEQRGTSRFEQPAHAGSIEREAHPQAPRSGRVTYHMRQYQYPGAIQAAEDTTSKYQQQ